MVVWNQAENFTSSSRGEPLVYDYKAKECALGLTRRHVIPEAYAFRTNVYRRLVAYSEGLVRARA